MLKQKRKQLEFMKNNRRNQVRQRLQLPPTQLARRPLLLLLRRQHPLPLLPLLLHQRLWWQPHLPQRQPQPSSKKQKHQLTLLLTKLRLPQQ